MFNILTGGHYPFSADSKNSILQSIQFNGEYLVNSNLELSFECLDFLAHCLQWEPSRRLTAAQLLHHPFLLKSSNSTSLK
jgi:serine/threonine protein kinase